MSNIKALIIGFSIRTLIPYIEKYEAILKEKQIEYDVILWDRTRDAPIEEIKREDGIDYVIQHDAMKNRMRKILPMYRFKKSCQKILSANEYSHIFVLTTLPAVFLHKTLLKKFKERYVLDIRDYSYESLPPYRKLVDRLIDNSSFTAISSEGFLKFLSSNQKIIPVHNITNEKSEKEQAIELSNKTKVNIGYAGAIRDYEEHAYIIRAFKNNPKFSLSFIGKEMYGKSLKNYAEEIGANNISFAGEYMNDEKPKIYDTIDVVNSLYACSDGGVKTVLPNRLYDAVLFKKPIIVPSGTYVGNIVEQYGLGLVVDIARDDIVHELEEYIYDFNPISFSESCHRFLKMVYSDQEKFEECVRNFIEECEE